MGSKKIELKDVDFKTDMSEAEKTKFKSILNGVAENEGNAIKLIKKFF